MKLWEKQAIFAKNVAKLILYIFDENYYCTFGEATRSKEQAELNAKKGIGILDSQHRKRLAVDFNLFSPEGIYLTDSKDYLKFGKYWKSLSLQNRWGGDFAKGDGNHFEMKEG